jgi:hypothetical protein
MNREQILAAAKECGLQPEMRFYAEDIVAFASRIESLVREEAEKDAKRYRVLRDGGAICAPTINPI